MTYGFEPPLTEASSRSDTKNAGLQVLPLTPPHHMVRYPVTAVRPYRQFAVAIRTFSIQ